MGFLGDSVVKNPPGNAGDAGDRGRKWHSHSPGNPLAWEIPWTEEPSRLQSMGSQRVESN